ncbi:MAG TPA: hypothetical protein VK253_04035, partial [Candidatus Binatia bacterium]|nr:hypothetical protein [Candidatus Binatia bacterium]
MKRLGSTKILLSVAIAFLVVSVILSLVSLFPSVTVNNQKNIVIDSTFRLSQNETYRQGLGAFSGGENVSVMVECPTAFMKNVSIATSLGTIYSNPIDQNISYSFTADRHYYEVIFYSATPDASWVHFQATVEKPQVLYPLSWLTTTAKTMFLLSLGVAMLIILKWSFPKLTEKLETIPFSRPVNKNLRNCLLTLLLISLVFWVIFLSVNSSPLAAFNTWYTDHARDDYVSSLFLKDGFSVFNQPLGTLASQDTSRYMFVTWPEMPHLYPLGSILLFMPFGTLLQSGVDSVLVYKLEIALFLVFAHICLYIFLKSFLKKNGHLFWKIAGSSIAYVSLALYAAGG